MSTQTIDCRDEGCTFSTDIETTSETNPRFCPRCGGVLYISGMPTTLADHLENPNEDD